MIPPLGQWIDPRAFKLPVSAFQEYLCAHGSTRQESPYPQALLFAGPLADDGEPITMAMPASEKAYDFAARVDDFFRRLSILEERHPMEILQEMLQQEESKALAGNGKNGRKRPKARATRRKTVVKK